MLSSRSNMRSNLRPGVQTRSPLDYWESLGPDSRMQTAVHEASHGGMAKVMGGIVRFMEIYPLQRCYANIPGQLFDRVQYYLAGWAGEHLYHGRGERIPNRDELREAIWAAQEGEFLDHGDNAHVFADMLKIWPEATERQLFERFEDGAEHCYQFLQIPEIWTRVLRTSAALCEHEHLSGAEMDDLWLEP